MKRLRDESGQVMVLTVLCMTVVLGFVAFAVDIGILLYAKRTLQTAADSGAIAGASELSVADPAGVVNAAQIDASQNGVTNGVAQATVTVNLPPASGPHAGNANYVEVITSKVEPTFFMQVFNRGSMVVSARAVATPVPSPTCLFTLSASPPGGGSGIDIQNGEQLIAPGCAIRDGSNEANAINVAAGSEIVARSVGVVGDVTGSGTITPAAQTGTAPPTDPLSSLTPPASPGGCTVANISGSTTIGPATPGGTVCYDSLTIGGSGTVTLNPGVYYINGSMSISNTGTITGSGLTFYFSPTAGSFSDNGFETLSLSAPTTGPYSGILFYQDSADTTPMQFVPSSAWTLNGIFYMPSAPIYMIAGVGSASLNVSMVVGSFTLTGNSSLNLTPYGTLIGTSPIYSPRLAE